DEHDLEDLLRALLHLHFDDVRRETRTPAYAFSTRTDFLVGPERVAVACKLARPGSCQPDFQLQIVEDAAYYERLGCAYLLVLIYDPEQLLREPRRFEAAAQVGSELDVGCIVTS